MNPSKTKIAFVGVGGMGQAAHLRNYLNLPECEVVAFSEIYAPQREVIGKHYGIRGYAEASEMLDREEVDGIVCSQPFQRHGQLVPGLLDFGKPVFTEKPIARSVAAGEQIAEAAARSGTPLMLGYHKRCDHAIAKAMAEMARWKASGEMGKMKFVRLAMPPGDWIANGFCGIVHSDRAGMPALQEDPPQDSGDGQGHAAYEVFVNYYIHQVNLLRFLLGESYTVSYADPSQVVLVAHSASGITGVIEMATHNTSIDWQESAFIAFEKGWIRVEFPAPLAPYRPGRVIIFRDAGAVGDPVTLEPQLPWEHAMLNQARRFLQVARGEASPPCSAAEGVEDLKIARDYLGLLQK